MTAYNEIYDETGAKRPAYAALEPRSRMDITRPSAQLVKTLGRRGVVGRVGIHAVPLVLDQAEYTGVLVASVLQRAFALQALFADIALGSSEIVRSKLLSEEDLGHVLCSEGLDRRTLRTLWKGQELDQIRFIYGPDLVRDQRGRWVVLEDNVGCVGGVADGRVVLDTYLSATGIQPYPGLQQDPDLKRAIRAFGSVVRPVKAACSGSPALPRSARMTFTATRPPGSPTLCNQSELSSPNL